MYLLLLIIPKKKYLANMDIDGAGITFDGLFANDDPTAFATSYENWRQRVLNMIDEGSEEYNADLAETISQMRIGNYTFAELLQFTPEQLHNLDSTARQTFAAMLTAFEQAAISGDYNLNNIYQSVIDILTESTGDGHITLQLGEQTIVIGGGTHYTIDWSDAAIQEVVQAYATEYDTSVEEAQDALTSSTVPLYWQLQLDNVIHVNVDGDIDRVVLNGQTINNPTPEQIAQTYLEASGIQEQVSNLHAETVGDFDVVGDISVGTQGQSVTVRVDNRTGIIRYWSTKLNRGFETLEGLYHAEWEYLSTTQGYSGTEANYKWETYGVAVEVDTSYTVTTGTNDPEVVTTPASNHQIQEAARSILASGHDAIQSLIDDAQNEDGVYTVSLSDNVRISFVGGADPAATLESELYHLLGIDQELSNSITSGIVNAIPSILQELANVDSTPLSNVAEVLNSILTSLQSLAQLDYTSIASGIQSIGQVQFTQESNPASVAALIDITASEISELIATIRIDGDTESAINAATTARDQINEMSAHIAVTINSNATSVINRIRAALRELDGTVVTATVRAVAETTGGAGEAAGNAFATGTLMGELGPEMVVSNGRYFVVGQNGPEMVNLASDAIVFNHLQTASLMSKGMTHKRGKAVTNERNAVAFAKGNLNGGPALASASAALASLKQLRAMWQSLLNTSLSDFAQKAGGGGGGGGGKADAFLADLDLWYNLLREIDRLEADITYQETLRSKIEKDRIIDGKAYYQSQKESIRLLEEEVSKKHQLVNLQKSYYDARVEELNSSAFGQFITYDDHGHLQHTDDYYTKLGDLMATNADDSAKYTAEEQYNLLVSWGFENTMKYDDSGKEIDLSGEQGYASAVQAFWDKMEGRQQEIDDLYDGFKTYQEDILKLETKYNEYLQQIIDNQISVENRVQQAIEDMRQRAIDEAQDQKDAIQESADKFLQGLNDSLAKERQMYETNESENELNKLRRQLAILQRSGGSASQIRSLQQDIASKEQDSYFTAQENQIEAIQKAADAEMERLDHQISIMEEQLAYEKEHGLLWEDVYVIMQQTPAEIEDFILTNSSDFEGKSTLQIAEDLRTIKSEIEQWVSYRDDDDEPISIEPMHNWNTYFDAAKTLYPEQSQNKQIVAEAKEAYEAKYAETADENAAQLAADEVFNKYAGPRPGAGQQQGTGALDDDGSTSSSGAGSNGEKATLYVFHSYYGHTGDNMERTNHQLTPGTYYCARFKKTLTGYVYSHSSESSGTITLYAGQTRRITLYYVNSHDSIQAQQAAEVEPQNHGWEVMGVIDGVTITKRYSSAAAPTEQMARTHFNNIPGDHGVIKRVRAYSKGGLADYTGLAMVHGSPQDPEAFLNAEETHMWRDKILGGNSGSLTSMLIDFQDMVSGMVSSDSYSEIGVSGSGVNIENAVVNMNATISNDYDARRAADTVMDEMIRIARKTTAQQARR